MFARSLLPYRPGEDFGWRKNMDWLERCLDRIGILFIYVAVMGVLILFVFVCLSAFMRYFLGSPFHFTEEVVALIFLVMVFLTLPYATNHRRHIQVTVLTQLLTDRWQTIAVIFNSVGILVFAIWYTILSFEFTAFAERIGAISDQASIPLWPWMALIPISVGLTALIVFLQLIRVLTGTQSVQSKEIGLEAGEEIRGH
jgi:TRAP-type C4-dicarboxylate transport system permease small subunit